MLVGRQSAVDCFWSGPSKMVFRWRIPRNAIYSTRESGSLRRILVPTFLNQTFNPIRNIIWQCRSHSTQHMVIYYYCTHTHYQYMYNTVLWNEWQRKEIIHRRKGSHFQGKHNPHADFKPWSRMPTWVLESSEALDKAHENKHAFTWLLIQWPREKYVQNTIENKPSFYTGLPASYCATASRIAPIWLMTQSSFFTLISELILAG